MRIQMQKKEITVQKLAEMVNGSVVGDGDRLISGFAPIDGALSPDITFLASVKNIGLLENCQAGAVIVPEKGTEDVGQTVIKVRDPYLAVAIIHGYFVKEPFVATGVHPRAYVGEKCSLGSEISIGPLACVGDRVHIGERVCIEPGAVIGDNVKIGDDTTIKANVTVYRDCIIGNRVVIHSGTVIGSDGYGYSVNERGEHIKRPQVGIVQIDDDVEIGANSCVDRAAYGVTRIKSGTKVDNLVQIAHNVVVGENCLLVSQVGVSGSTTLGRNVVMGGQAATTGHITLGDQTMVAARGAVTGNTERGAVVGGAPAIPMKQWAKSIAIFNKLSELQTKVRRNSKSIEKLLGNAGDE